MVGGGGNPSCGTGRWWWWAIFAEIYLFILISFFLVLFLVDGAINRS